MHFALRGYITDSIFRSLHRHLDWKKNELYYCCRGFTGCNDGFCQLKRWVTILVSYAEEHFVCKPIEWSLHISLTANALYVCYKFRKTNCPLVAVKNVTCSSASYYVFQRTDWFILIYFSSIVKHACFCLCKSRSNPFLELTSTKQLE